MEITNDMINTILGAAIVVMIIGVIVVPLMGAI